jgi:hypothetical protein
MLPVPSCVDHPCPRGESIGGCAEHGQVPMMVRMDFGSRSREECYTYDVPVPSCVDHPGAEVVRNMVKYL